MIEIVYKENTRGTGTGRKPDLPKNVRQIGEPGENRKIYIEDYVITYLKKLAKEKPLESRAAVLLGDSKRTDGIPYLFIKSAIALEETVVYGGRVPFTDEVWGKIYETIKEYFAKQDILGWFLSIPGYPVELDPGLLKIHINQFGGVDKILMAADPIDGEEDFFAYESGRLNRQKGYYIFYERNEAMQRYMVDTGAGESIETVDDFEDRAARSFRTLIQEKKEYSGQKRVMTFLYMASTFLVMVVLVIGITLINNYEKMEGLELTLSEISQTLEKQDEEAFADQESIWTEEGNQQLARAAEEENAKALEEGGEVPEEILPEENQENETDNGDPAESEPVEAEQEPEPEPESAEEALSQNVISIPESYTVQKGDTLLKISRKIYGRDDKIDEICSLNKIKDVNHILVGQKLLLP